MSDKQWVVVRFKDGKYKIWADYDQTWGSPAYEVIGYAKNHPDARQMVRDSRTQLQHKRAEQCDQ